MRHTGRSFAAAALALSLAAPAQAQIAEGTVACFARAYAPEHMAAHPGQSVVEMVVVLDTAHEGGPADGDRPAWAGATVRATVRDRFGEFFANWAICDWDAEASLYSCGIECDGGRFDIELEDGGTAMLRNEQWGFVLYGGCGEDVEAGHEVTIPADAEHAAFRLYPLPIEACPAQLWGQYDEVPF